MKPSESVPVAEIVVRDRVRKDLGNLLALEESVRRLGLLHPVVLNSRRELIAGSRRLAVAKRIGWAAIPARVVDTLDDALAALQAERDENNCRADLAPTEIVELGRKIEALEKPKAKERKAGAIKDRDESGRAKATGGNLPPVDGGKTRDKVGKALGVSGKTYEKAKQVTEAAEQEPEKFGDLPAKMDAESVDAAHKELKRRTEPEPEPAPPEPEPAVEPVPAPEPEPADAGAEFVAAVETLCREMDQLAARMKALKASPFSYAIHIDSSAAQVEAARKALWQGRPAHPCPYCRAEVSPTCRACKGTGRVKKTTYDSGTAAMGDAA